MPLAKTKQGQNHTGVVLDSVNSFDIIECEPCGFKHIVPIPSFDDLQNIYRETYYSEEKPLYLERHREDLDWWNVTYSERYDTFEEFAGPDQRRLLDVGSGPGFFLLHGQQRGWQTLGVEPSRQAAEHSRKLGVEVVESFFTEQTAMELGKFDGVHMSEVLEHISNPKEMLQLIKRVLNPQGLLCVVVPNDYNPFQYALQSECGYKPWWLVPPHHINYFNFDSLSRLLSSCGFEVILHEATFPIDMFLLMGEEYVGNDALGRQCHGKRKQFELNLEQAGLREIKRGFYRALASQGLGREVVLFARSVSG